MQKSFTVALNPLNFRIVSEQQRFYREDIITGSRFFQGSRGIPSAQMPPPQQSNPCGYQNMPAAPSGKDLNSLLLLTIETEICDNIVYRL